MPSSKPFTYLIGWTAHDRFYYKVIQSMKACFQKHWLIITPTTQFCVKSLDILAENGWGSLYCSFRSGKPMSCGALKGWKLEQI